LFYFIFFLKSAAFDCPGTFLLGVAEAATLGGVDGNYYSEMGVAICYGVIMREKEGERVKERDIESKWKRERKVLRETERNMVGQRRRED
jgi:hypothetical protein